MISNCGKDENGRYTGGYSGDQTGNEWHIIPWYNRPWNCVLRHPDEKVRKMIAEMARDSANNNNIGYDQWQRTTYFDQLEKNDYKPKNIKAKCEADCSSGVCSIVKSVGYRKGIKELKNVPITTTHYMRKEFKKAGFKVLTDRKYLKNDDYLLPGDILLNDGAHVATNLDTGSKVKVAKPITKEPQKATNSKKYVYVKTNGSDLFCRASASITANKKGSFANGTKLKLIKKTNDSWYKVKGTSTLGKKITGYCSSKWLKEV